jgi:hypothetical protein
MREGKVTAKGQRFGNNMVGEKPGSIFGSDCRMKLFSYFN